MQHILALWDNLPQKLRFLMVGGLNTGVSYALFMLFLFILGQAHYQQALILAWLISSVCSFVLQKLYVFKTQGNWLGEYMRCIATWSLGYAINAVTLELVVKYLQLQPMIGQIFAIAVTTVVTYVLFKHFAFKQK